METDVYYIDFDKSASTTELQTPNHKQDEGKAQKSRGSVCLVLMTVCLGIICVVLLIFIILQFIIITSDRDLVKSYKNTVEEFNQTINRLQDNYTDLMTEKYQLNNRFNSLSQKKLELETRVKDLTAEKNQMQNNFNSLSQKKLELESKVTSLSEELQKAYEKGYKWGSGWFISSEEKSWSESRQYCRDLGADLIIINTEEKQKFISSFINDINARVWKKTMWTGGVWIGLTDIDQEGNMKWVDNSPLEQGFWYAGEPNNKYGSEDCVELMPSLSVLNWNDLTCSSGRYGICEKKWG